MKDQWHPFVNAFTGGNQSRNSFGGWDLESAEIQPSVDSGLVAGNKIPQLLDDSVDELLLVTLILTELSKHVVFPTSVLHPTERERKRERYILDKHKIKKMMIATCISLSDLGMYIKLHQITI